MAWVRASSAQHGVRYWVKLCDGSHGAATLNTNQVIDSLLRCTAGQIVACNVLAGVEHRLLDRAWVKDTLAWMGRLGAHAEYDTPEKLVEALQDLRDDRVPSDVAPGAERPDIRLRGDAAPRPFHVEVSCVVSMHVLRRILSHEDRLRLRREGLALPSSKAEFMADPAINEWRRKPANVRTARFNPSESLGRSVAWFTRRDDFTKATTPAKDADRAQRARDALGLAHHETGTTLAALHFPPTTLSKIASARPTFADAASRGIGGPGRFKTWPDSSRARRRRRWGTTVDLRALDAAATSVDGCPERVTKEIGGTVLGEGRFEFELLGSVRESIGTGDAADAAFAARLTEGRTLAQIAQKLKAL